MRIGGGKRSSQGGEHGLTRDALARLRPPHYHAAKWGRTARRTEGETEAPGIGPPAARNFPRAQVTDTGSCRRRRTLLLTFLRPHAGGDSGQNKGRTSCQCSEEQTPPPRPWKRPGPLTAAPGDGVDGRPASGEGGRCVSAAGTWRGPSGPVTLASLALRADPWGFLRSPAQGGLGAASVTGLSLSPSSPADSGARQVSERLSAAPSVVTAWAAAAPAWQGTHGLPG